MNAADLNSCPSAIMCKLTGWSRELLRQRVASGVAVRVDRGRYNAYQTLANERHQQAERRNGVVPLATGRLKTAQAERAEIENQIRRKELIPAEDVQALCGHLMVMLARSLSALERRLPPAVIGKSQIHEIATAIRREVNDIRQAMADELGALAALGEGESAPPGPKRRPKSPSHVKPARSAGP